MLHGHQCLAVISLNIFEAYRGTSKLLLLPSWAAAETAWELVNILANLLEPGILGMCSPEALIEKPFECLINSNLDLYEPKTESLSFPDYHT
jgi:hypothetical protein